MSMKLVVVLFFHFLILLCLSVIIEASYSVGSVARGFRASPASASQDFSPFLLSTSREFAAGFLRDSRTGFFTLAVVGVDANQSGDPLQLLDTVWMANRDNPFRGQPEFLFSNDTSLLVTVDQKVQWNSSSFSSSSSSSSSVASSPDDVLELADTGNFRLDSRVPGSRGAAVWQSFDHPADTLLQGQNFTQIMKLVSSISAQEPSSGPYSLQLQGDRLLLMADSEPYWTNAALREHDNGSDSGSGIYMRIQPEGYLGLYLNETTRIHFVSFSSLNRASANFTRRARMDPDGNFRIYYWQNGQSVEDYRALVNPCEYPDSCGRYGICSSDSQNKSCKCPAGMVSGNLSASFSFSPVDASDPSRGCRADGALADFCDSTDDRFVMISGVDYFATRFEGGASGSIATTLDECRAQCLQNCSCRGFFYRNDSTGACFHTDSMRSLMPSSNTANIGFLRIARSRSHRHRERYTLAIFLILVLLLAAIAASIAAGYYIQCARSKRRRRDEQHHSDEEAFLEPMPGMPKRFPFSEIEQAKTSKRISAVQLQGCSIREFQAELAAIARLGSHSNLVALLGYNIHGGKRYLVYDGSSSSTRSLREILDDPREIPLDWSSEAKILLGIARGLAFLHAGGGVHGDLVPTNVLVDASGNPRLALYGLAHLMRQGPCHASDDVYAFGAIVLELLDAGTDGRDGAAGEDRRSSVREIGKSCVQREPVLRPSMAMVVDMIAPKASSFGIEGF